MKRAVLVLALCLVGGCASSPRPIDIPSSRIDAERVERWQRAFARGELAQKRGRLDEAERHYSEALAAMPEFWATYNNLGLIYLERREYGNAVAAFRTAADRSGSNPTPLVNLGIAREEAGFSREAHEAYLEALEREPRSLPALRGAMKTGRALQVSDETAFERIKTGLLVETDPIWHDRFLEEKIRIEAALREQLKSELGIGG